MSTDIVAVVPSGQPDLLDLVIQQGVVIDPEVRLIGDNYLTPEQNADYRERLRALAIEASNTQLENIARQRRALDEAEAAIQARLEMAEASTNGHAYPGSRVSGKVSISDSLTEREAAICQLIPEEGITVMSLGKLLADSGHFPSGLIVRRQAIAGHLAELEERGIVTSQKSGRWTKFYLSTGVFKLAQASLPASPSNQTGDATGRPRPAEFWNLSASGKPGFRPGSATETVFAFIKKAPARGRSLEETEKAGLNLKGANLKSTLARLQALGLIVNRGERGAPHYYLAVNDPGEKPISQSKTPNGGFATASASEKKGAKQAMVLQAVPKNQALVLAEICQVLADNPEYNSSGKMARELQGAVYQALLILVEKGQVVTFSGHARQKAYYRKGGSATNPFTKPGEQSGRTTLPRQSRQSSSNRAVSNSFREPVIDVDPRKLPKPPIGAYKKKLQDAEHFDTLLFFCATHFGPRFRLSEVVKYYAPILRAAGFHEYGSTPTMVNNGLVQAVGRSQDISVDSNDKDVIIVLDKGSRGKNQSRKTAASPESDDDDDDSDAVITDNSDPPEEDVFDSLADDLEDEAEGEIGEEIPEEDPTPLSKSEKIRTYEDEPPPISSEPAAPSSKPVATSEDEIDDMILSVFRNVSRPLSLDDILDEIRAGRADFVFDPTLKPDEEEFFVVDSLDRLVKDQGELEDNDDGTWSLPR